MFRAAILGCGGRAKGHARPYSLISRGAIVAACDRHEERRRAFGEAFGVNALYADLRTMLEAERPDVLHIVTRPHERVEPLAIAADCGVRTVVVEKPVALWGEDYRQLRAFAAATTTKVCVNTQLHFHAANLELKAAVAAGRIGEVRFIDASARSTPLDQGVHILELAHSYAGFSALRQVFGQVADPAELDSRQPAPGMASARFAFENGIEASLVCGLCAPLATRHVDNKYYHKRIAVFGTAGYTHWTMASWEKRTDDGAVARGEHDYDEEDDPAQARLTEAAFDWLLDPARLHPCSLDRALDEFEAILGLYVSALEHRPVELPFDPPDGLGDALRRHLPPLARI